MLFCSADRRRSSFLGNYNRKQSFLTPLGVLVLPASLCLGLQKDKLQSGQAAAASRSLTSPVTSRPSPPSPPEQPGSRLRMDHVQWAARPRGSRAGAQPAWPPWPRPGRPAPGPRWAGRTLRARSPAAGPGPAPPAL